MGNSHSRDSVIEEEQPLQLRLRDFLVCSDIHVPGESVEWINKLLLYRQKEGIQSIVVAGDFWNFDAVSRWECKDKNLGMQAELQKGIALLQRLTKHAKVYLICGNHDIRLPKQLDFTLSFKEWIDTLFIKNCIATDFDHLYVISGPRKFRICHPDLYSTIKGRQASFLSQDLHEDIIMGHQHYLSLSTNKTGKYLSLDSGCLCDPEKFRYKKAATSRCPSWENGFFHIKEGKVRLISNFTF